MLSCFVLFLCNYKLLCDHAEKAIDLFITLNFRNISCLCTCVYIKEKMFKMFFIVCYFKSVLLFCRNREVNGHLSLIVLEIF